MFVRSTQSGIVDVEKLCATWGTDKKKCCNLDVNNTSLRRKEDDVGVCERRCHSMICQSILNIHTLRHPMIRCVVANSTLYIMRLEICQQ